MKVKESSPAVPHALPVLLLVSLFLAMGSFAALPADSKPSDLDYATTRSSEKGIFTVTFVSRADPIPLNKLHSWQVHVEEANGKPVAGARIAVNGGMPQHGHGLPTQPQVTQDLGGGDYLVEGMKFQMHGWWVVNFLITSGEKSDKVTFNLRL
jgi:hypothetical protein